ncbi:MAG: enoyl-CoA hydratase/isomerase family protein [bacterium]|nr:enoyl-CoA hydratase/isomerase family protein [bacterium]
MTDPATVEIRMDAQHRNALGESLIAQLEAQLDAAGERGVLLSGTAGAFSAGLDLGYVGELDVSAMEPFLRRVDALVQRIFTHPAPTVALAEGHAIAGGCVLMQACDFRVCKDDDAIKVGVNEVALGACFPPAILQIMRYRLPRRHLERVMLGAQLYTPRAALEVGLLDEVAADPRAIAVAWLERLASHTPETYAVTKRALRADAAPTARDERRFVEEELTLWTSDDLRSRIRAALGR